MAEFSQSIQRSKCGMELTRKREVTGPVFMVETKTPLPRSSNRNVSVSPSSACLEAL